MEIYTVSIAGRLIFEVEAETEEAAETEAKNVARKMEAADPVEFGLVAPSFMPSDPDEDPPEIIA